MSVYYILSMNKSLKFISRLVTLGKGSGSGNEKIVLLIKKDNVKELEKLKLANKNLKVKIERL